MIMAKIQCTAKLIKDLKIYVDDGRSHAVCLDQPPDDGDDMGPTALALAVMSFAGCYASIFALTARKMRIKLKDLDVKIEAIKSEEIGTITSANLDITVKAEAPVDRIERLHQLTLRNCPVGKLFEKAGVKTDYQLHH